MPRSNRRSGAARTARAASTAAPIRSNTGTPLKKAEKDAYRQRFPELLNRQGDFDSSILQEFDFAYKDSTALLATQPYLIRCDETQPIVTVKFTGCSRPSD